MEIGDRVRKIPESIQPHDNGRNVLLPPMPGIVTYIHPRGRFYVVRFDMGFSEAFPFREVD